MFTQYFGNFLFESNVITREQFMESLRQIPDKRAKLGILAIEAGFMNPSQVEEIHALQLHVDQKFGELAVEKDYLTEDQLGELLSKQSSPFSVFSQILCDAGYMTYSQLTEQMGRYREKCGMTLERFSQFQNDEIRPLIDHLLLHTVCDETRKLVISAYLEVFLKNIIRFISGNIMLGEMNTGDLMQGRWISCQKITGPFDMTVSLTAGEEDMLCLASAFSHQEFDAFDLVARDISGEFLNCNNGIFIANMIEHGLDLGLEPQMVSDDIQIGKSADMLRIALTVDQRSYWLHLAF